MIFYGYREATLQTKIFDDEVCTHCSQKGNIACTVFSKHFHIMWIPLFPIGKRTVIWCRNCENEYKQLDEATPDLRNQILEFSRKQKAPFWQWIGLLLFVGFIGSTLFFGYKETKNTKLFLESPDFKDVYCMKYENGYSLMYIVDIRNDSIFFLDNNYATTKKSEVKKLHAPQNYELDDLYVYTHNELKKLYYIDRVIITIWRDLPFNLEGLTFEDDEDEVE